MSTGVSISDIKKFSPSYKAEKPSSEQRFSPSRQVKSRTVLSEAPYEEYSDGLRNRPSQTVIIIVFYINFTRNLS